MKCCVRPLAMLFAWVCSTPGHFLCATPAYSEEHTHSDEVFFSRDVLPLLSDRCFHCHGPDETHRETDLRLDLEDAAKADLGGYAAITAGSLDDSEIWQRITSDDADLVMPPSDSHRKPLTSRERDAIRRWLLSGAKWGKHWSFEPIRRPAPPVEGVHPIDAFVEARLEEQGMALSPPANPHTRLRRLSFDLTGLPPTTEELSSFGEGSDAEWSAAIDRLLRSPHHAERMAMWWLDAARYSDSDGYQQDATRQNWPWRDWVIRQFQMNRSFRDFTLEQFAGDLLPDATDEQKLATCFHRNHMTNGEGGRDPEESRIDYVIDRVNTTGTVWLGLTLGCVQCHSHKFDPISQRDYYSLTAFFNSIDEDGRAGMKAKPYLEFKSPDVTDRVTEMAEFVDRCREEQLSHRKAAEKRFDSWIADRPDHPSERYRTWWTPKPEVTSTDGSLFEIEDDGTVQTYGPNPVQDEYRVTVSVPKRQGRVTGFRIEVLPHESHVAGRFTRGGNGEFALTSVLATSRREGSPTETQLEISRAVADYEADDKRKTNWDKRYRAIAKTLNDDARDGWTTEGAATTEPHVGVFELETPWQFEAGDRFTVIMRQRSTHGEANIGRFRVSITSEAGETIRRTDGGSPIAEWFSGQDEIDDKLRRRLLDQFLLDDHDYQTATRRHERAKRQLQQLKGNANPRKVMVLAERSGRRETHVLVRGVWDAKGETVQPAMIPSVLDWPAEESASRLDLARWVMAPENPLTARVTANHLWQLVFGNGLVRTPEDFGLQGEMPTHPKLLDWLAAELIENDWDLQHLLRLILTSKTYQQSSAASAELRERDPENRLMARAPRYRLPAWMIRDAALRASGLLNDAVGGPPVRPYQPDGVWAEITMGRFNYEPSLGPAQYRRTVYAFWRRSSAPAFLFDSAQRRVCEVGVRRTNTPLQALTLLNDVTMLEASRVLADSVVTLDAGTDDWITRGLQSIAERVLSRRFNDDELDELKRIRSAALKSFAQDRQDAIGFCTVGQQPAPAEGLSAETAAWMTVSSLILNLDEAMTRE